MQYFHEDIQFTFYLPFFFFSSSYRSSRFGLHPIQHPINVLVLFRCLFLICSEVEVSRVWHFPVRKRSGVISAILILLMHVSQVSGLYIKCGTLCTFNCGYVFTSLLNSLLDVLNISLQVCILLVTQLDKKYRILNMVIIMYIAVIKFQTYIREVSGSDLGRVTCHRS